MPRSHPTSTAATLICLAGLAACGDQTPATPSAPAASLDRTVSTTVQAPAPLVGVPVSAPGGPRTVTFWPYTGVDLQGTRSDPITFIFTGKADPRQLRAALLSLNGDRSALGPLAAFTCTWADAMGDPQTGYLAPEDGPEGWVGSVVQLACGPYTGPRFHIRLFRHGDLTIGSAHYEVLIPGTANHAVLSWELAQQLVTGDLIRTGNLGAAPLLTPPINDAPTYGSVPAPIYQAITHDPRFAPLLPVLALVPQPDGSALIPNDGRASTFLMAGEVPIRPGVAEQQLTLTYGQVIPKPFCTQGTTGYLHASGPVTLTLRVSVDADRTYHARFAASGTLSLVEVDPTTGQPVGAPYQGIIAQNATASITNGQNTLEAQSLQREVPAAGPTHGSQLLQLRAREHGTDSYRLTTEC